MNYLLTAKRDMTPRELSLLNSEYQRQKKRSTPMWLLWLFFGCIGAHRFYLGDFGQGISHSATAFLAFVLAGSWNAYVAETTSSVADMMIYSSVSIFFFAIPLAFALFDAFFINRRLAKKNAEIEMRIIDQIKSMRTFAPTTAPPAP